MDYRHFLVLAPTQEILDALKKHKGSWQDYETALLHLMASRRVGEELEPTLFENSCLLCSEQKPDHCHRRLVAEYLREKWTAVEIEHLE